MTSPLNTLQEQQLGQPRAPWRILIVCALLNRTHGRQVRPMIDEFFARWPTPESIVKSFDELTTRPPGMYELIQSLGFGNKRIETVRQISLDYVNRFGGLDPVNSNAGWVDSIRGCGQYAKDSINIFWCDVLENVSSDTWLNKYIEWRRGEYVGLDQQGKSGYSVPFTRNVR